MSEAGLTQCVGMDAADGLDGGLLEPGANEGEEVG